MQDAKRELTPEESWNAIHATFDRARASMYIAGITNILLYSGALVALAFFTHYAVETLAPAFATDHPWYPGIVWGVMGALAMIGNSIIGHRAGKKLSQGDAARNAGIRVFAFWMTVVAACFLIPAAAGMWKSDSGEMIPGVTVGVIALGYILFGILFRPMLAAVGAGLAASYYLPAHFAGDAALAFQGAATLAVCILGALVASKEQRLVIDRQVDLDETIHQPTRLRIMTMLVGQSPSDRLAYPFIQKTLGLTGGNLTIHLRKLENAGFLSISKEFLDSKPRTWVEATPEGRRAFTDYLSNLLETLNWKPPP